MVWLCHLKTGYPCCKYYIQKSEQWLEVLVFSMGSLHRFSFRGNFILMGFTLTVVFVKVLFAFLSERNFIFPSIEINSLPNLTLQSICLFVRLSLLFLQ